MAIKQNVMVLILAPVLMLAGSAVVAQSAPTGTQVARLVSLEDREAIRLVLRDYGRLLDERRFDEFGQLFAEDGEYVAGPSTRGPKAIAEGLRRTFAGNSLGLAEPNFHVLFNERITLAGAKAVSTSQSFFVAPGADGAPRIVLMASYDDVLVKTAAGWRFARRVVKGNMSPRPATAKTTQAVKTTGPLLAAQADLWDKAIVAKDRAAIEANLAEDFNARVYGDTALLTGRTRMNGRYKGKPFISDYGYTDTYAMREGKWQAVSVQITKITP